MKENSIDLFVPGRLCLFGEHSDWTGQMRKFNSSIIPGQAIVACTEEGIFATARISDTLKLRTVTSDGSTMAFEHQFNTSELRKIASEGGYFSYIAGVASYISTYYDISGIEIDCYKQSRCFYYFFATNIILFSARHTSLTFLNPASSSIFFWFDTVQGVS